ncbi:hypothetical protein SUDANB182_06648 [Streptomyces sp. SudanB182_2057]
MATHLQGSLFDQTDELRLGPLDGLRRTELGAGAWIDVLPGWLSGADALFERLAAEVPWRAERRKMYDNVVAVPRLLAYYGEGDPLPHPVLDEARAALSRHYAEELGEPFTTAGLCFYRDGRDSVAWHGDRIDGAPARTPWSRSSPSARPATCCCARRAVAARRCAGRSGTAI